MKRLIKKSSAKEGRFQVQNEFGTVGDPDLDLTPEQIQTLKSKGFKFENENSISLEYYIPAGVVLTGVEENHANLDYSATVDGTDIQIAIAPLFIIGEDDEENADMDGSLIVKRV